MSFAKRLRAIIKEERLSQARFAEKLGVSRPSIEKYLSETHKPSGEVLMKIATHPEFEKYTLWLMTGKTSPEAGQVCPAFSTQEQCGLVQEGSQKQA